jgi:hypothetical protein
MTNTPKQCPTCGSHMKAIRICRLPVQHEHPCALCSDPWHSFPVEAPPKRCVNCGKASYAPEVPRYCANRPEGATGCVYEGEKR